MFNGRAYSTIIPCRFHFRRFIVWRAGANNYYGNWVDTSIGEPDEHAEMERMYPQHVDRGFKAGRDLVMNALRRFRDNLTHASKDPDAIVFREIMRNVEEGAHQIVDGN